MADAFDRIIASCEKLFVELSKLRSMGTATTGKLRASHNTATNNGGSVLATPLQQATASILTDAGRSDIKLGMVGLTADPRDSGGGYKDAELMPVACTNRATLFTCDPFAEQPNLRYVALPNGSELAAAATRKEDLDKRCCVKIHAPFIQLGVQRFCAHEVFDERSLRRSILIGVGTSSFNAAMSTRDSRQWLNHNPVAAPSPSRKTETYTYNRRQTITVLAVDNGAVGAISLLAGYLPPVPPHPPDPPPTWALKLHGSALFGVRSGAILYIEKDFHITEFQEEILVGCLSVVSLLGSLSGGRTSDAIGRKWTMGLGAIVFQTGAAIMTFAPSFTVLMIGRLLAGVGIGLGAMVSGVYIAEISPASVRGSLTSLPEICINFGILLGYVSNYAFSDLSEHINWKIMLGVGILPSVFIGFAFFVIPESPRWLMMEKRVPEARAVLLQISESEAEVIAKGEAQGMVSKFLGIMLGIALGNHIGSSVPLALISCTGVTTVHMYCNLKSYQSIELRTLNPYRASLVFSEYLLSGQIPSVKEVNDEEPFFLNMSIGAPHKQSKILSAQANDILTMSLAPRDSHEDQVQFALERGVSAVIGYSLLVETKLGNSGVVENDLKVARTTGSQLVMLMQEMFSEALEILRSKKDGFIEILQERSSVLSGFPAYILGHSGLQCFSHTSNAAAAQLVEPVHVSRMTESSLQQFSVYVSQSPDFLQKTPDTMDGLKAPNVMDGFTTGSDLGSNLVPGFHSIEGRLNNLLDGDGGISKRKDATKGYLKLLLVTAVEGDNAGGASKSNRSNFHRTPIIRKLLKVLEFLASKGILTSELINGGPRLAGMESFRDSRLSLTRHSDQQQVQPFEIDCDSVIGLGASLISTGGECHGPGPLDVAHSLRGKRAVQKAKEERREDGTRKKTNATTLSQFLFSAPVASSSVLLLNSSSIPQITL